MKLKVFVFSLPSQEHPHENQDAYFIDAENATAGVFDGMGGLLHGKEAAGWCAECFKRELVSQGLPDRQAGLEQAFLRCHALLKEKARKVFGDEMATTAVVAKIHPNKSLLAWASVGDSRIYHWTQGSLRQISEDDSLITQARKQGWLKAERAEHLNQAEDLNGFNQIENNLFKNRNIVTQALGIGEMRPTVGELKISKDDALVLTTDGVHDNLTNREIEAILKTNPDDPAKALVNAALNFSQTSSLRAKPDDMTAVIVRLG